VQKFIRSTGFRLRVYSIQQAEPAAFHARSALWSSQEDQTRRGPVEARPGGGWKCGAFGLAEPSPLAR
jgi:hypothetical protein